MRVAAAENAGDDPLQGVGKLMLAIALGTVLGLVGYAGAYAVLRSCGAFVLLEQSSPAV